MNPARRIAPYARRAAKLLARHAARSPVLSQLRGNTDVAVSRPRRGLQLTPGLRLSDVRCFSSAVPKSTAPENETQVTSKGLDTSEEAPGKHSNSTPEPTDSMDRGAIGGFMRGLIGGRDVAAEDAFVAEAKEQGIELPPPPPQHRADLVAVKRRRRREDEEVENEESIRDRLFSRFAGSAFMRSALDAKDRIAERIDESNNPVINLFRNMYDRIFAENEMAMVVGEIREDDAAFTVSEFLRHAENVLIPSILSAYLAGDRSKLSALCTEDACRTLNASIREREAEGIIMDTNVLDISDVELTAGRLLEDAPVLIITFSAQQINCLRDLAGNVIEGAEDDIRAVYYVWAFVREVELEESVPTGGGMGFNADEKPTSTGYTSDSDEGENDTSGKKRAPPPWKMMEMVIRGAHSTI